MILNDNTLRIACKHIKADPSGKSTVGYLSRTKLSQELQDRYFREAEYLMWVEPWEGSSKWNSDDRARVRR